ncbi:CaiB/BaiF CoA transferase family protein [Pseudomonas lopnurensis]|uniref:CaiB/BaiF CoA transferase family protein n=1 Tax=Pseudomonas lopnurensis TaxID=1477517 RepID=UPI0028ADD4C5|nr:CaiB/BaiF CoA-transferase family protein [Pseudomonas lopnurensis]
MFKPLDEIRVLDLTNVLAGPFCCHQLAHMGAEVIKIEVPGSGDLARQLGADPTLNEHLMGVSFMAQNAGKRSITLDLKHPNAAEVFRRLVRSADVLVENFRPGVMQRLGLGHEELQTINPRLIYCAISGFGQEGPLSHCPAYDQIIQGISGVMSVTGSPENSPCRVGYPVSDTVGGLTAAFAIAAALADRTRKNGCFIDISMLEATLATMGWAVSNYLVAGREPQPVGNDNTTASPSGTFRTADGVLNIAANKQEQFVALCRMLGLEALLRDPRFAQRQARLEHRAELTEHLEQVLMSRPTDQWWQLLTEAGVPCGPVLRVAEVLAHPQVRDRGIIARFDAVGDMDRPVDILRPGIKVDHQALSVDTPPPALGEHTDQILAELGYSDAQIRSLHEEHAV